MRSYPGICCQARRVEARRQARRSMVIPRTLNVRVTQEGVAIRGILVWYQTCIAGQPYFSGLLELTDHEGVARIDGRASKLDEHLPHSCLPSSLTPWLQRRSAPPFAIPLHPGATGSLAHCAASFQISMESDTSSACRTRASSAIEALRTRSRSPQWSPPPYSDLSATVIREAALAPGYSSFSPRLRMVCWTRLPTEAEV